MKELLLFLLFAISFKRNFAQDSLAIVEIERLVNDIEVSSGLLTTEYEHTTHPYKDDTMIVKKVFFHTSSKQLKKVIETVHYRRGPNSPMFYNYSLATYYYNQNRPLKVAITRTNEAITKRTTLYYVKKKVVKVGDHVDPIIEGSANNLLKIFNKGYK